MKSRPTELFDLKLPVIQTPMAFTVASALAAAVSRAGGLGLIGGGYGDPEWIETQFALAVDAFIGCSFSSLALDEHPDLLEQVLGLYSQSTEKSAHCELMLAETPRPARLPTNVASGSYASKTRFSNF